MSWHDADGLSLTSRCKQPTSPKLKVKVKSKFIKRHKNYIISTGTEAKTVTHKNSMAENVQLTTGSQLQPISLQQRCNKIVSFFLSSIIHAVQAYYYVCARKNGFLNMH